MLVLLVVAFAMFIPLYWMFVTSFAARSESFLVPNWFPSALNFDNYVKVFETVPLGLQILNSLQVTIITVVGQLLTSSLAAFALAKLRFRGREGLFAMLLVALMIPLQVTVIPIFILMRNLGLIDTLPSLWLPALLSVFGIFFLRQHFLSMPIELEDAAKIDGAGPWRLLFQIYLPLSGPILSALGIFAAINSWNDFFWPNIMISSPEKMPIPLGLVYLQAGPSGDAESPAAVVFAGIALVTIPLLIFYLLAQDRITKGISLVGTSR